jgi:hypothetical protein
VRDRATHWRILSKAWFSAAPLADLGRFDCSKLRIPCGPGKAVPE